MSRIPEAATIDLQLQAEKLFETFGGAQLTNFKRVREQCGDKLLNVTDAIMRTKDGTQKAPSAGTEDLRAFFDALVIIRNKIAQLERDGFTLAAHEARKALECPGYRMIGENEPFETTVPVMLMMVNPELTLSVLAKKHEHHWCNIEDVPKGLNMTTYQAHRGVVWRTDLFKQLHYRNAPLFEKLKGRPAKHIHHRSMDQSIVLPDKENVQRTKIGVRATFACACDASKGRVLSRFTKAEQEHIALWEFELPKVYTEEGNHISFGLHKEKEHARWQRLRKPFCSTNIINGYGAIAYPGEAYRCFDAQTKRFEGTRILLY